MHRPAHALPLCWALTVSAPVARQAVAVGAAIQAAMLDGQLEDLVVMDVWQAALMRAFARPGAKELVRSRPPPLPPHSARGEPAHNSRAPALPRPSVPKLAPPKPSVRYNFCISYESGA